MPRIIIASDLCPIGRNEPLFERGDAAQLLGDLQPEFDAADLVIANLECPLIRVPSPIEKVGPNLGAPTGCATGMKAIGIDVAGLANNHIMDHGPSGLRSTIQALGEHAIHHVGAGENLHEARSLCIREVDGVRIGILAVAEHEFGIAGVNTPGANPLDVIDFVRNIGENRTRFDKLIVLVHGGNEHYPYPRPGLMDTCRFLAEQGADAVICQHSHCAGCMETHHGVPIVYGQGNFLFDLPSHRATWSEGALVCLESNGDDAFRARWIPYRQSDGGPGARKMEGAAAEVFLAGIAQRSEAITDATFVEAQWAAFCKQMKRGYLHGIHGRPGILRRVAGKLDLLHFLDPPGVQRSRLNLVRCESHREALLTLLDMESRRK